MNPTIGTAEGQEAAPSKGPQGDSADIGADHTQEQAFGKDCAGSAVGRAAARAPGNSPGLAPGRDPAAVHGTHMAGTPRAAHSQGTPLAAGSTRRPGNKKLVIRMEPERANTR